ncbi:hypothetical protein VNI00_014198, partial [Paramarasmius palmivorus]
MSPVEGALRRQVGICGDWGSEDGTVIPPLGPEDGTDIPPLGPEDAPAFPTLPPGA